MNSIERQLNTNSKFFLLVVAALLMCCQKKSENSSSRVETLPYYNDPLFTPKWFLSPDELPADFHQIPDFDLTNQLGQKVTAKSVVDKIYIVDFFFTSCPGICPKMTSNMSIVQEAFQDDDDVLILSHSVTPAFDSVSVLKRYAERHGVMNDKWYLLTGSREHIYDLGRNFYFVEEDLGLEKSSEDFLHTENFILVDENRYLRGIYSGLNKTSVNQLIADVKTLQAEM